MAIMFAARLILPRRPRPSIFFNDFLQNMPPRHVVIAHVIDTKKPPKRTVPVRSIYQAQNKGLLCVQ